MNFLTSKYRTRLQIILLVIYTISLIAGILHYHHFEFSNNASIELGNKSYSNKFLIFEGNNYECIIQHSLTNLQTALLNVSGNDRLITIHKTLYPNFEFLLRIKSAHLTGNLLRAPPQLS
jgi:hypothetical protein